VNQARPTERVWYALERVWYEPSTGLRFAGVVLGPTDVEQGIYRVYLCGHYWQWKSKERRPAYRDGEARHIAGSALYARHEESKLDARLAQQRYPGLHGRATTEAEADVGEDV
jgi:hypothetical protein